MHQTMPRTPGADARMAGSAEAYLDPVRAKVMAALTERPEGASVAQLAARTGQASRLVRRHVDFLLAHGLAEVVGGGGGPTGRARLFRAEAIIYDRPDLLGDDVLAALARATVLLLLGDVSKAAGVGSYAARDDDWSTRIYGEVDERCLEELSRLHLGVCAEIGDAIEAGRGRQTRAGCPPVELVAGVLLFRSPLWAEALGGERRGGDGPPHLPEAPSPLSVERAGTLVAALAHPLRGRLLAALVDRPGVTIRQLSVRLGTPPRRVRHALEALLDSGLAEISAEVLRPGVIERRYGARPWLVEEGTPTTPATRAALCRAVALHLKEDLARSAEAGTLGAWDGECQFRWYAEVDERCRLEIAEIHRRAFPRILSTIEEGRRRVAEGAGPGTEVVSALFLFEAPLWRGPLSGD
jgi:DNA-binding transcriptional ArsR family regulator